MFNKLKSEIIDIKATIILDKIHRMFKKLKMGEALNMSAVEFKEFFEEKYKKMRDLEYNLAYRKPQKRSRRKLQLLLLYEEFFMAFIRACDALDRYHASSAIQIFEDIKDFEEAFHIEL